jgi:hypothetical protein
MPSAAVGANFLANVPTGDLTDTDGHGTHVTGDAQRCSNSNASRKMMWLSIAVRSTAASAAVTVACSYADLGIYASKHSTAVGQLSCVL